MATIIKPSEVPKYVPGAVTAASDRSRLEWSLVTRLPLCGLETSSCHR